MEIKIFNTIRKCRRVAVDGDKWIDRYRWQHGL